MRMFFLAYKWNVVKDRQHLNDIKRSIYYDFICFELSIFWNRYNLCDCSNNSFIYRNVRYRNVTLLMPEVGRCQRSRSKRWCEDLHSFLTDWPEKTKSRENWKIMVLPSTGTVAQYRLLKISVGISIVKTDHFDNRQKCPVDDNVDVIDAFVSKTRVDPWEATLTIIVSWSINQ